MTTMVDKLADVDAAQRAGQDVTPRTRTVLDLIRGRRNLYAGVLNDTIDPERFVRVALATVSRNPALLKCTQESLLSALMLSAQLGLEPGTPLGHAYLVPFKNECTFIVGYQGYLALARRSGQVASVYAEAVFDGDDFSWELGLDRTIKHRPLAADRTDYEKVTHVYAVAKLRDPDADPIFVVLTKDQVEQTRKRSRARDNGPWKTDPIPMALKTAVRRLAKWMPLSIELAQAAAVDETNARLDTNLDGMLDDLDTIDVEAVDNELPPAASSDAAQPSPPPADTPAPVEGLNEAADAMRSLAGELAADVADEVKPQWIAFIRENGLSSSPARWTDSQCAAVVEFLTQPLDGEAAG